MEDNSKIKKNTFKRNFLQTFNSELIFIIITTISGVLLARVLGPSGRGEFLAVTIWANLLIWYLHLNIYQSVIFYWKKLEEEERVDMVKTLFWIGIILGSVACLVGEFVIVPYVLDSFNSDTLFAARLFFLALIPGVSMEVIIGILAAEQKFLFSNIIRILNPFLSTIGVMWLYYFNLLNVTNALYVNFTVLILLSFITIGYGITKRFLIGNFNLKLIYTLWYGAKAQGGTISAATSGNATQMILSALMPPVALGYFSTAQSSIKPITTISNAIEKVSFPKLTGISKEDIHHRTMNLWRKSLILNIMIIIPFAFLLPYLIPFVYGSEYISSITPALILLLYSTVNGQCIIIRNAINGFGKTFVNTKTEFISALFIIISLTLTVKSFGVNGASFILLISVIIKVFIFYFEYVRHIKKIHLFELIPVKRDLLDLVKLIFTEKIKQRFKSKNLKTFLKVTKGG